MVTRILLVSRDKDAKEKYRDALEKFDVQVVPTTSFSRLPREIAEYRYHGVALDLPTKIKALKKDRAFVYKILGKFPIIQLKLNKKTGKIRSFFEGGDERDGLEAFIRRARQVGAPKKFRYFDRKPIHFNVILSRDNDFTNGNDERSITMNVSEDGCQILSVKEWEPGGDVWLVINELNDKTPVRGKVRHALTWGEAMEAPGIGLEFEDITEEQARELREKYLRK
ncbi:MAG: PilZ domain-containing protein [Desulfobacterales bacterium]|nr:PilZ domain-containing protein [Desulfobacterales bacterium]